MKKYPLNYSSDIREVIDAMSLNNNVKILGSASLRSQLYVSDYDGYEVVSKKGNKDKILKDIREKIQSNIKKLIAIPNTYIMDFKCGVIDEWRIIPITATIKNKKIIGFDLDKARDTIDSLLSNKIISSNEAKEAHSLLPTSLTVPQFLAAKAKLKYHVIRWKVPEILNNKKILRDNTAVCIEQCLDNGLTKLDVVSFLVDKYTEFSCIYSIKINGKLLDTEPVNIKSSLEESIIGYMSEGSYFKVLKRIYSISKYNKDNKMIELLNPILNSSLGIMNLIVNDINTILNMDNKNITLIKYEVDQFINRLGNVTDTTYLKHDSHIMKEIETILKLKNPFPKLKVLRDELNNIVQSKAKVILKSIRG